MISASQAFIDAVNGNGRSFRVRILCDGAEVPCNIISITANKGANDGQTFSVGSVFSHSAEIVLGKTSYVFENKDVTLQIGVLTDYENETYEYITIGEYTVIKVQKSTSQVTLSAVGSITSKMNVPLPSIAAGQSVQSVATAIQAACGVSVTFVGITGLSNTLPLPIEGTTCRGALEIITFLVGGYATENNAGGVEIHKFSVASPVEFPTGRSLTEPVFADHPFEMTGVKVIVSEEHEDDEGTVTPEVSYQRGSPIRQTYQSEYMTEALFNVFASNVIGYNFMPASVDMSLGDPRLEPWDTLLVEDGDGDTYIVPCHLITGFFDGGYSATVLATGESETDEAVEGSITKQVGDMAGQLAVTQIAATQAKTAAAAAQASADDAADAAEAAQGSADDAAEAAQNAWNRAGDAATAAQNAAEAARVADGKAVAAGQAAESASRSAGAALDQLGIVEDVVGVLTWASEHGDFTLTRDQSIQEGKVYFTRDATTGEYIPVVDPQASALSTYYELTVDEAMETFIMAHLAVTDRGLWVLPSGINTGSVTPASGETEEDARARTGEKYKVLLSNSGMLVYDGTGSVVATYGESITFSSNKAQYIGGENAYIIFNPTTGTLNIGGNLVTFGGGKTLSEMLAELDSATTIAENTLIYDHTYEYVRDSNNRPIRADFTAFLYRGGVDVKTEYTPASEYFFWYLKKEDKTTGEVIEDLIGTGYTCQVSLSQCGYGAEVIGKFVMQDNAEALSTQGDNLTTANNEAVTVRASGDSIRVRDLTVSTTIFPTEKLMIVGAEDEHLVTIQTLQNYLNANLDKQVLFDTTAGWSTQTTLVSDANTLYVYTDHQRDSGGHAVAGIKAGDGLAYVVDLPFTDAVATEHIADTTRHITASERSTWNNHVANGTIHVTASDKAKWDSAVKCYYAGTEQLVFAVV